MVSIESAFAAHVGLRAIRAGKRTGDDVESACEIYSL
jgi:hypothetical protein